MTIELSLVTGSWIASSATRAVAKSEEIERKASKVRIVDSEAEMSERVFASGK